MKNDVFKYLGMQNQLYCFMNREGKQLVFRKCRKDLINQFQLYDNYSLNQWFRVSYFETYPENKKNEFLDKINIISDLTILNL